MRIEEHPTPRTDAISSDPSIERRDVPVRVWCEMAQVEIEIEIAAAKSMLSELNGWLDRSTRRADDWQARENDLERRLRAIHALVEGDADGTIDATPYEKLCNEIAGLTGITL